MNTFNRAHLLRLALRSYLRQTVEDFEIVVADDGSTDETIQSVRDFIEEHPDIFPGFFHYDLEGNVRPKLKVLQDLLGDFNDLSVHRFPPNHAPLVAAWFFVGMAAWPTVAALALDSPELAPTA